jgi:hypothetical protein
MPVTSTDFNLQGRIENYRERVTRLLYALDQLIRQELGAVNQERLQGKAATTYEIRPPRWSLAWKHKGDDFEANLMAFVQGGAWVVHGRMGLDRPFRNLPEVQERDRAAIRQEINDQLDAVIAELPYRPQI